ncbi:hypothetical protein WJX73_003585 [Symbiochloris irregularis]|uniref:Uncharacterized protein n=1 Tax=Symbiochloris irregularis TaxID=706552 RepID=A0AAW1NP75_9CHLO
MPVPEQFPADVVACFLDIVEQKQTSGRVKEGSISKALFVQVVLFSDFLQAEPDFMSRLLRERQAVEAMKLQKAAVFAHPPELWGLPLVQKFFGACATEGERVEALKWIVSGPEAFYTALNCRRSQLSLYSVTQTIVGAGAVGQVAPWQLTAAMTPSLCLVWLRALHLINGKVHVGKSA